MAKIDRRTQKIFGSAAAAGEIGVIGSFAAGSPSYSTDPQNIQALSQYLGGWYDVVVGQNSPAIQDMNALDYLITRQLAYLFQAGISEWDGSTVYYTGSWAADSSGNLYVSLTDNNTGNLLANNNYWRPYGGATSFYGSSSSPYQLSAKDNGSIFVINTSAAFTIRLPIASNGFKFTVKDGSGLSATNNITVQRNGSESIEGLASNYLCRADWGAWTFVSTAGNWFII